MCAKWNSKSDPNIFLKKIESILDVKDGNATFSGFMFNEYFANLCNIVELDKRITYLDKNKIVSDAIFAVGKSGKLPANSFLAQINRIESAYINKPVMSFKLVTSISINKFCKINNYKIGRTTISFRPNLSKPISESRDRIIQLATLSISGPLPENYINVIVTVRARSYNQAAIESLDSLDFLRGIWNWYNNRKTSIRWSTGRRSHVNKFVLGPIHTIHDEKGKSIPGIWWYQPEYVGPSDAVNINDELDNLYKFTTNVRKYMKLVKYPDDIVNAITRYNRALDTDYLDDSFLKLWGVLEYLTDNDGDTYNKIVKQASFLFKDREYHKAALNNLKECRNIMVHAVSEGHDMEIYTYQVKRYVEKLLEFHLGNKYNFDNIKNAAEFLDVPDDIRLLRLKISMYKHAIKFLDV